MNHATEDEQELLKQLRRNGSFLYDGTSPTTKDVSDEIRKWYIKYFEKYGDVTSSEERVPIDDLTPTQSSLDKEQIEILSGIYKKDNYAIPSILVVRFDDGVLQVWDGHHRCYIAKYLFGMNDIPAYILDVIPHPDTYTEYKRIRDSRTRKDRRRTYGELEKEDFKYVFGRVV